MSAPDEIWEPYETELRRRLLAVGFGPIDFPATPPREMNSVIFAAFAAPYALLFSVRISGDQQQHISLATSFACETMRLALAKGGANDWTRDGYVLAAIADPLTTESSKQELRSFEQSRSICRRHAVWPEFQKDSTTLSWTPRLDRITVLALPASETLTAPPQPPQAGPNFIEDIHNRLKAGASYKLVAEETVKAARAREDFHAS